MNDQVSNIPMWAFYLGILLLVGLLLIQLFRVLGDKENPIAWWQFIAIRGRDGRSYADITKLGQAVGIVIAAWVVVALSARVEKLDWIGFSAIFGLALVYFAGVTMFQSYMKSRQQPQPDVQETKP